MPILSICWGVPEKSRKSSWIRKYSRRDEDGFGEGVGLDSLRPEGVGLGDLGHVHGEGDGKVERVVCGFVYHDK